MTNLLTAWKGFEPRLVSARRICVLSDFDGTLAPIVERPDLALLPEEARRAMSALAANRRVVLGVVSGRALGDLYPRVNLPDLWYVGNHGYEMRSPQGDLKRFYEESDLKLMAVVADELERAAAGVPGALVERKGPVTALHYRKVEPARAVEAEQAFLRVVERYHRHAMVSRGHMVLEARLRSSCNKGMAVRHIRKDLPAGTLVIYLGDDLTDRDAFREVRGSGVSVEVGVAETAVADYTLADPGEVAELLRRLSRQLEDRPTRIRPGRSSRRR
ncbi:MAG TPA: trehalose-phosphatase [Planctomycetota bacterium]|nr:trehalose-phosphatase [Planctomycetota bacterium]